MALLYILLIFILLKYFSELILIYMLFYFWDLYLPTFSNNFAFPFNVFLINVPSIIYCANVHFKFAHKYVRHHTYCCQDSSKYFVVNSVLEGRNETQENVLGNFLTVKNSRSFAFILTCCIYISIRLSSYSCFGRYS